MFIVSQLWLTSHPKSAMVLLDTGTSGPSSKIYSVWVPSSVLSESIRV